MSSVNPMKIVENLHRSPSQSCNQPKSSSRALLAFLFVAGMVCFTFTANAQNKINTVVGGGTVDPSPLLASAPGAAAVVEDAAGNLYIAPPTSQYIFVLSKSTGLVTLFAGTGYISDHHQPGQALTEPLWNPFSLATDAANNIYISDTGNNAIKMVNPSTGTLQTVVGTSKPCFDEKCNDNGSALKALLWNPQGVVLDAGGNIYIADTLDNRVRCVVEITGGCGAGPKVPVGTIVDYAGTIGKSCASPTQACGDNGKANQALLNTPIGLAIDKNGYLYIADSLDNRIRRVGAQHVITTVAGTGKVCVPAKGCGDAGLATSAYLNHPLGVALDANQNIYIADTNDDAIRVVSSKIINTWAGQLGAPGFTGDGGKPNAANLDAPAGIYVGSSGNVYISDSGNQRVREVTTGEKRKVINTIVGGGSAGDGGPATGGKPSYATLAEPYSIAVDANNNWYIADTANNRIRVVNRQSSTITIAGVQIQAGDIQTVAGTGSAGYTGDNGPAVSATLNAPFGVAVDANGNIYVADSSNAVIREVDGSTGIITTLAGTENALTLPSTVSIDPAGNLFIADPPAQVIWELSGSALTVVAGNGTAGFSGNGGPATDAELSHPFGVVVDPNDNLYIADTGNNRVRCVIGIAGGCNDTKDPVGTIVEYAYNGETKFGGDNGPALKASRWLPKEVALDHNGNLFVGGGNDAVIQRVDASTGLIITVAGIDTETYFYGFFGDGYAATKSHINDTGIAIDSTEMMLIADTGNDRIRNVPLVPVDALSAVALNFGDETVGQTTQPQVVTLKNTGSDDLSFTSIVAAGDFAQTNTCPAQPAVLAPTLSCQISITFTPTEKGVQHGTVTITDNGYQSPHIIKLVGVGD